MITVQFEEKDLRKQMEVLTQLMKMTVKMQKTKVECRRLSYGNTSWL